MEDRHATEQLLASPPACTLAPWKHVDLVLLLRRPWRASNLGCYGGSVREGPPRGWLSKQEEEPWQQRLIRRFPFPKETDGDEGARLAWAGLGWRSTLSLTASSKQCTLGGFLVNATQAATSPSQCYLEEQLRSWGSSPLRALWDQLTRTAMFLGPDCFAGPDATLYIALPSTSFSGCVTFLERRCQGGK